MLRVGRLISGTIYVMTLGPAGLLRALGGNDGRFPLVITGPADSLREGLEYRLNNPNFRWSLSDGNGNLPKYCETMRVTPVCRGRAHCLPEAIRTGRGPRRRRRPQ